MSSPSLKRVLSPLTQLGTFRRVNTRQARSFHAIRSQICRRSNVLVNAQHSVTPSTFKARNLHTVAINAENFQKEIVEAQVPVVLKFEASWCGPCKQLAPMLNEALETYADSKVHLATLDVDSDVGKQLSAQFQVRSIPAVFVIFRGQVIDHLAGVPSQEELNQWVQKLIEKAGVQDEHDAQINEKDSDSKENWLPADVIKKGTIKLKQGKYEEALELFGKVTSDPTADAHHPNALAGMARASLKLGKLDNAKSCINGIPDSAYGESSEVRSAAALLSIYEKAEEVKESIQDLEAAVEKDARDFQSWYSLSLKQAAEEQWEDAMTSALKIVRLDKNWEKGKAKDFVLSIIKSLGEEDPVAKKGRAKLANALF